MLDSLVRVSRRVGYRHYASILNLTHSRSHQAYYTALSRSSSAEGTAIVSSFSDAAITRGLDDQLKREFRNLEVLNDITRMRFEDKLPAEVSGITRNQLIKSYLDWKGEGYEVPDLHPALRWQSSVDQRDDLDTPYGAQTWQLVGGPQEDSDTVTKDKVSVKRKISALGEHTVPEYQTTSPSPNISEQNCTSPVSAPRGYKWDAANWSCPYDSLFTIVHCLWASDPIRWT
ncbi:hypothetical protein BD626DRAFT_419976, partial [Schizophyllum amplum]